MSRDNDTSPAGPQGRGANAYPSGTPPYGTRPFPSLHPQERPAGAPAPGGTPPPASEQPDEPAADEPRTETTLTTRIRINIPGSRPIPPVVVRTTVDENAAAAPQAAEPAEPDPAAARFGAPEAEAEPEKEKTSDWFAPRKPANMPPAAPQQDGAAPAGPVGPAGQVDPVGPETGSGQGSRPGSGQGSGQGSGFAGHGAPYSAGSEADAFAGPGLGAGPGSAPAADPYGERRTDEAFAGYDTDYDTGSNPVPPLGRNPAGGLPRRGASRPPAGGSHDTPPGGFADPFAAGTENFPPGVPRAAAHFPSGDEAYRDLGDQGAQAGQGRPEGQNPGARPYDDGPYQEPNAPAGPGAPAGRDSGRDPGRDSGSFPGFAGFQPPAGPTTGPATGSMPVPPAGPNGFRPPAPSPAAGPPAGGRDLGDTLVGGIPTVPSSPTRSARPGGTAPRPTPAARPVPTPAPASDIPAGPAAGSAAGPAAPAKAAAPAAAAPSAPAKKKGRSKIALLGVAVCAICVVAYGAGLLMNHADVPKGTTVLGVDIGDKSKEEAGKSLDQALGGRTSAPLTLTIDDKKVTLKPSIAGLSFDSDATVRAAAHSDYNPVSVISSLFGGARTAEPVILVDEDKLKAALQDVAKRNGTATDGMIRFAPNKVVPVPGKAGTSFSVDAAANQVAAAYRTRAETGADTPVDISVTTVQPKVTEAELNRAAHGFAKNAMSHVTTVEADATHSINIGPAVYLPKILTMLPDDSGHLQPHIDLTALKSLYGNAFDGVLIKRPGGGSTAVTAQDVADALLPALNSTSDKVVVLKGVTS
ncbi:hypothetical protein [Streptomyces sp. NBC_01190]|uniref:hypothetical protein n=1 Tax=Streptomyces sp. NBC_01190 TaxID=2903767 RepID=UPI003864AF4B|nr:hypothetical protein OG519_22845 [Streptomyces sp. NBC_01190]